LKIDDAVVMYGLEDSSGRVDALEDRGQSPPRRLGAKPRDHLCGAGNIGQIGALDCLTPGLTRPRTRVAGFGEVGFRLCLGHRLGPRLTRSPSICPLGLQCGKRTDKASAAPRLCFEALRLPSSDERGSRLHTDQGGSPITGRLDSRPAFRGIPNFALAVASGDDSVSLAWLSAEKPKVTRWPMIEASIPH